jgi:hypothetical protein
MQIAQLQKLKYKIFLLRNDLEKLKCSAPNRMAEVSDPSLHSDRMSKPHATVAKSQMTPSRSQAASDKLQADAAKAAEQRRRRIETLEKYYAKYERKIKRNERAIKKPYVFETPGFEGITIPEDLSKLWMRDIIGLNARDNVRRTLPSHRARLEQLADDIEKLKAGCPTDEISPMARATIYRKWNLGAPSVKELLLQGCGLWY